MPDAEKFAIGAFLFGLALYTPIVIGCLITDHRKRKASK